MRRRLSLTPYTIPILKTYKNGKTALIGVKKLKWFTTPHRMIYSYREGEYNDIEYTKFNPGSRAHIEKWLRDDTGFEFPYYTPKGNIKVDVDSLTGMTHEAGKMLVKYLKTAKDQSQLGGGEGSLIKNYNEEKCTVSSRIDTNGTQTGRFTSSKINTSQIPGQKEFRELFRTPKGWSFLSSDFDGQENVILAELLYPYDNGRLNEIIKSGEKSKGTDLHSLNAKACGVSRGDGKAIFFGFLFGSSPTLTGYSVLGNKHYSDYTEAEFKSTKEKLLRRVVTIDGVEFYPIKKDTMIPFNNKVIIQAIFGKHVQDRLIESTTGLKELIKDLKKKAKDLGYYTTLGGRRIPIRHIHASLNTSTQGGGGEAMKYFLVSIFKGFTKAGLIHGKDFVLQAVIYDEVNFRVKDEHLDVVAGIVEKSYEEISRQLGMKCTFTGEVLIGGRDELDNSWYGVH